MSVECPECGSVNKEPPTPFEEWFKKLKTEVEQLPENIKTFFDLRDGNISCWRDHYDNGDSPQEAVQGNVDDLARMQ